MESKYLVGYIHGQPAVMWDKIQDFEETTSDDGEVTLKFKEDGVEYEYHGTPDRGYREIHNRAPAFQDYQYMGRRTALRHDFLDDRKRIDYRDVRARTNRNHELEDDDDFEDDQFLRDMASGRRRPDDDDEEDDYEEVTINGDDGGRSCGHGGYFRKRSPCGGEEIYTRNECGGYRRVYGDGPCGAVMGDVSSVYSSCGGGYHC